MNIQVTNINIRYVESVIDGVQVYFNGYDDNREVNINGYIPLTADEYTGNESIAVLTEIVKQTVSNKLTESPTA